MALLHSFNAVSAIMSLLPDRHRVLISDSLTDAKICERGTWLITPPIWQSLHAVYRRTRTQRSRRLTYRSNSRSSAIEAAGRKCVPLSANTQGGTGKYAGITGSVNNSVARRHVRFWHLADIDADAEHVRY